MTSAVQKTMEIVKDDKLESVGTLLDTDDSTEITIAPVRDTWSRKIDFILSCVGFAVGLGNIWRFPYLCYKNGGGAFFIPYLLCLFLSGIPLFILEVGLGQYMSLGGLGAWKICPLFQGIGVSSIVICFLMNIYYILVLTWAMYYLAHSFTTVLPWSHCGNEWNTERCFAATENSTFLNFTLTAVNATTAIQNDSSRQSVDATIEFWERKVLQITPGIEHSGGIIWELALCLFAMWVVVYFCIWRGVRWTGKIIYFTALFPYVVLGILLVRGLSLEGAGDGIIYYLKPDFSRLADPQVWTDGATQIFFSYAIALGGMITLGSYNTYNNNFYKDCFIIACVNSGTSFIGGFAVFSVLGFMAKRQNIPISEVADAGPGLAFIAYPKAVAQMPAAPVFSVLFFVMIFFIGLDSQFVGVESFITPIVDLFPKYFVPMKGRMSLVGIYCAVSYICGLPMVTRGGMYIFQLFDYYSASGMVLLWLLFWESIVVGWIFGAERFYDAMETMLGKRPNRWLLFSWKYTTPCITMGLLIFQVVKFKPLTYNKTYIYPDWAQAFGLMLACASIICVPSVIFFKLIKLKGNIVEGGMCIFQLFDYYSASGMVLLWLLFWESIVVGWIFGAERFYDAMETMLGKRPNQWLLFSWKYTTPCITMGLLIFQVVKFKPLTYNKTYIYPDWAQAFGLMLAGASIICVPSVIFFKLIKLKGNIVERLRRSIVPELREHQVHNNWITQPGMRWKTSARVHQEDCRENIG